MRIAIASLLFFACTPAAAIEIHNFKSGLVCSDADGTQGADSWVCHQTKDILITDQGRCVYNRVERPCTWFGFEFDYTAGEGRTKLQCVVESSRPTSPGNPSKVLAKDVMSQSHEIELVGTSGHFANPMYYIFAVRSAPTSRVVETFTCKSDNAVVFQARFNLQFPETVE
jgi:hypothetical protein